MDSSEELSQELDKVEKELNEKDKELLSLEETRLGYARDITILMLKKKDLEIPITQKKCSNKILARTHQALKRKYFMTSREGR